MLSIHKVITPYYNNIKIINRCQIWRRKHDDWVIVLILKLEMFHYISSKTIASLNFMYRRTL